MLKLQTLRQEAYGSWETICRSRGVFNPLPYSHEVSEADAKRFPFTNTAFRSEVRQRFADLRYRLTWEKAASWLLAQAIAQAHLEPYEIVAFMVSPDYDPNDPIRQHYGEQVIEAMFQFPEIIDLIRQGLEQIYRDDYTQEQQLVEAFIAQGYQLPGIEALPPASRCMPFVSDNLSRLDPSHA
jgi:hypothetical protein